MSPRAPSLAAALSILCAAGAAEATKRRFEPTDLELEEAGTLQADIQFGPVRSDGPLRLVLPDAEIDLGLAPNIELDVDFTFGLEGPAQGPYRPDHGVTDNTWIAAKIGLLDARDSAAGTAWALGVQIGPKIPLASDARGTGYEALLLAGRTQGRLHLVLNAGGLVDPGAEVSRKRPIGAVAGLDVEVDVRDDFAVLAEVGTVLYVSGDPHELEATLGMQWSPTDTMDLSIVGLVGLPPGSDRYGVLFGVARKFQLWR